MLQPWWACRSWPWRLWSCAWRSWPQRSTPARAGSPGGPHRALTGAPGPRRRGRHRGAGLDGGGRGLALVFDWPIDQSNSPPRERAKGSVGVGECGYEFGDGPNGAAFELRLVANIGCHEAGIAAGTDPVGGRECVSMNRPGFDGGSFGWCSGRRLVWPLAIVAQGRAARKERVSAVEIGVGHSFVAVRAEPSRSDPTAEELTILAPTDAEVTGLAGRALIDRVVGPRDGGRLGRVGVAGSPVRLFASVRAEASPARGVE